MYDTEFAEHLDLCESVREDCKKLAKKDKFQKGNFLFNSKYVANRSTNFALKPRHDSRANTYKAKTLITVTRVERMAIKLHFV